MALISGGARGQGEAEARLFLDEGANVVVGDILDDAGEALVAELGEGARYVHLDVAQEQDWLCAVHAAEDAFGGLDVLVNNAGVVEIKPISATTLEDYMRVISINQVGTFLGIRCALPALRTRGGGSIVNISSVGGLIGTSGEAAYASSKFAVRGLTKVAALEFGQFGIRVNSVHPGGVATPMVLGLSADGIPTGGQFATQPISRIGQPEEIAQMVLFLASDESSYCTGAEFVVDGGWLAGKILPGVIG